MAAAVAAAEVVAVAVAAAPMTAMAVGLLAAAFRAKREQQLLRAHCASLNVVQWTAAAGE